MDSKMGAKRHVRKMRGRWKLAWQGRFSQWYSLDGILLLLLVSNVVKAARVVALFSRVE